MSMVQPPSTNLYYLKQEILDADERCVPPLLLTLQDVLTGVYGKKRLSLVLEIWRMTFPESIMKSLSQDFTVVSGAWKTACDLVSLLIDLCVEIKQEHINSFVSDLMLSILQIITKILKEHSKVEQLFKGNLCGNIAALVTLSTTLMKSFQFLPSNVLSSKHFMQLLMVESTDISLLAVSLLKAALTSNRQALEHVSESRTHNIADEMAFKITATKDSNVAKVSLETLLFMVDSHSLLLQLFSSKRYRGFKTYITKWSSHGFDFTINRFVKILDKQLEQQDEQMRFQRAATIIQSVYRGHVTRKRLTNANIAMQKFQQHIREKKKHLEKEKEKEIEMKTRRNFMETRRRRSFVNSKLKQLKVIETIPARTVDKFLSDVQNNAATKIQSVWLGWNVRRNLRNEIPQMKMNNAASLIQKWVRKWQARLRKQREEALLELLPHGLTDERKVQLQQVIGNIREKFPKRVVDDVEFKMAHEQTFQMLSDHVAGLHTIRRRDEHRKALIAQLSLQSDLLRNMPQLREVGDNHVEMYASKSAPVIIAGREKHFEFISELKKPWWAKLDDNLHKNNSDNDDEIKAQDKPHLF